MFFSFLLLFFVFHRVDLFYNYRDFGLKILEQSIQSKRNEIIKTVTGFYCEKIYITYYLRAEC